MYYHLTIPLFIELWLLEYCFVNIGLQTSVLVYAFSTFRWIAREILCTSVFHLLRKYYLVFHSSCAIDSPSSKQGSSFTPSAAHALSPDKDPDECGVVVAHCDGF